MATVFRSLAAATSLSTPTSFDCRRLHLVAPKPFPEKNGGVLNVRSHLHVAGGSKMAVRRVDSLVTNAVASKADASATATTKPTLCLATTRPMLY